MSNAKQHDPRTKTSIIKGHMAAGDWRNAIRVAARLPRLDKHRCAVLDAHGAYENPRFYTQIGKDAETLIEAGAAALCERFGHNQKSKTMTIEKTYSKPGNARRAAEAAGHKPTEFSVYKIADGKFGWRLTEKPAKTTKAAKRAAVLAAAQDGKLPSAPDFSAPTHARYVDTLNEVVALAKAGNIEALKRLEFKTYSSSPKAIAKYRDLAVIALQARVAAEKEAAAA